jgi:hypothetical protein
MRGCASSTARMSMHLGEPGNLRPGQKLADLRRGEIGAGNLQPGPPARRRACDEAQRQAAARLDA